MKFNTKFSKKYKNIVEFATEDFSILEEDLKQVLIDKTPLSESLTDFLTSKSKRLRPVLGFLFLRMIFDKINKNQRAVLLAVELIHNATLIHDDVIDKSDIRRNKISLNAKFDENLAVVAGDYLLSIALEKIINTNSIEVVKIFTDALKQTCLGEISQYFSRFNVMCLDDYIEKSKHKTAFLFEIGLLSGLILSGEKIDEDIKKKAINFGLNFGIAFQIRDDLINILSFENKPDSDLSSGIYTAPVIFAMQENPNILNEVDILQSIKNTKGIEKAKDLMENYFDKALVEIKNFENNKYFKHITELIDLLKIDL